MSDQLPIDIEPVPLLSEAQLGHIRHIQNLAHQLDGEWAKMGTAEPGQEGLASYRYQLSHMAYALGLAHYHRLPAAPGFFQDSFDSLIRKMLREDVWGYWRNTSQSGPRVDPSLQTLREPWTDPVVKENIMYSGHVHAMVGMYGVLFDDDKYEKPGSVVFRHDPVFWGMGPEVFEYSFSTLNDVIYWQMVENGWLGVACEPNCIFIVCNQFPMLGFRFHDLRKGTSIAAEAGESYRAAWADKGIFTSYGSFIFLLRQKQNEFLPGGPGSDAHAGAIMHAWNREFVRSLYPKQVHIGLRKGASGAVSPFPQSVLPQVFQAAAMGAATDHIEDRNYTWTTPDFGAIAMWLSELGDQQTLDALLKHADSYMNPSWDNHGLYYPRNDRNFDEQGRMTYVDPLIGNAMLAYARLNVPDGLWKLYNEPWSSAHFSEPCLKTVHTNVDVLRAAYLPDEAALVLTLRGRGGATVDADLVISNAPLGKHCDVYRDASLVSDAIVAREVPIDTQTQQIQLQLSISKQTDLVLIWKSP